MVNMIYQLRDVVEKRFGQVFACANDATAVRQVCNMFKGDRRYKDLELWRFDYGYDVETGAPVPCQRCVVALPAMPEQAPSMPVSEGSTTIEQK